MKIKFATSAFKDYRQWEQENPKIFKRINRLLENIKQSPFEGIGNPELLKYNWQGYYIGRDELLKNIASFIQSKTM